MDPSAPVPHRTRTPRPRVYRSQPASWSPSSARKAAPSSRAGSPEICTLTDARTSLGEHSLGVQVPQIRSQGQSGCSEGDGVRTPGKWPGGDAVFKKISASPGHASR